MAVAKENKKYHLFLFLISPILALIYGIRTKQKSYIRWSIFVFVVIYGSTLHPSHIGDGADHFKTISEQDLGKSFSEFWEELIAILTLSPQPNTATDPYIHILRYILGTLFDAPRALFVVVSIIFGFFYSGAIVKLMSYVNWKSNYNKFYFTFFLILFILYQTPGNMQSVRQGTAIWVVIYSIISYHQSGKIKYLFFLLLAPFIHFAYLALIIPFLVVLFSNYRNPKIYFIIFMVSVLAANLVNPEAVNEAVSSRSSVGETKTNAYYVNEERAELKIEKIESKDNRFYKEYKSIGIQYNILTGSIIFMFLILRTRGFEKIENTLFSYGLAGASFANFFSFNFAVHSRTWLMAAIFILSLFLIFLSKQNLRTIQFSFLKVKLPLFVISIAFFPYLLFLLSANLNFTSVYVIFFPFTIWFDFDVGISIRGFIGLFI